MTTKQSIAKSWRKDAPATPGWYPTRHKAGRWFHCPRYWNGQRWSRGGKDEEAQRGNAPHFIATAIDGIQYRERPRHWS